MLLKSVGVDFGGKLRLLAGRADIWRESDLDGGKDPRGCI